MPPPHDWDEHFSFIQLTAACGRRASPLGRLGTVPLFLENVVTSGLDPIIRHHRWRSDSRARAGSPAVSEHPIISTYLQCAMVYDRFNMCNLVSSELLLK